MAKQANLPNRPRQKPISGSRRRKQRKKRALTSQSVTISELDPHTLRIAPACRKELDELLSCSRRSWSSTSHLLNKQNVTHFEIDDRGNLLIPQGLVDLVHDSLVHNGRKVSREFKRFRRDLGSMASNLECPERFLALKSIESCPRGLVFVSQEADAARTIAVIGDLFPEAQIAVCASSWREARALRNQIACHTDRNVVLDKRNYANRSLKEPRNHVIQVMAGEANEGASMKDFFDIRLDVGEAVAFSRKKHITPWLPDSMRVFSILKNRDFSRYEQLTLFEEYSNCSLGIRPEHGINAVRVLRLPGGHLEYRRNATSYEFLRDQIWNNPSRNDRIARLARALYERDPDAVTKLGVAVPPDLQELLFEDPDTDLAILVANLAHGQQLHCLLPHFTFDRCETSGMSLPSYGLLPLSIITHEAAEFTGISARVIIRADGGFGWPFTSEASLLLQEEGPVILIDIDDQGGPRVLSAVKSRLDAYYELGWNSPQPE